MEKYNFLIWWATIPESGTPKIEYQSTISSKLLMNMCPIKENSQINPKRIKLHLGHILSFLWENMDKITGLISVIMMIGLIKP